MKVVINRCYGGFCVSDLVCERLGVPRSFEKEIAEGKDFFKNSNFIYGIERTDPRLVALVEELGEKASGVHAQLEVVEIPDGVEWYIEDYDGLEHIAEAHRTWS